MPRTQQQQLPLPLKKTHGGKRAGAGRPNRSGKQAHVRRPRLELRHPLHVTLRLNDGLPNMRRKETFRCFRQAVAKARAKGLRVVHFAVISNHLHMILEPAGAKPGTSDTSRALQSFGISLARRLNRHAGRRGAVFHDRYHLHVLRTPTEVRNALDYVLTNEARHRGVIEVSIDPFSSAYAFRSWRELCGRKVLFRFTGWNEDVIEAGLKELLAEPKTWLLTQGWRRGREPHPHRPPASDPAPRTRKGRHGSATSWAQIA